MELLELLSIIPSNETVHVLTLWYAPVFFPYSEGHRYTSHLMYTYEFTYATSIRYGLLFLELVYAYSFYFHSLLSRAYVGNFFRK